MVDHKTQATYRRYAIVDSDALREAATKIDATNPLTGTLTQDRRHARPHSA